MPHAPQLAVSIAVVTQWPPQHTEPPPILVQSLLAAHLTSQTQVLLSCWQTRPAGQLSLSGRQVTHRRVVTSQRGVSGNLPQSSSFMQPGHPGWKGSALQSGPTTAKSTLVPT